MILLSFYLFLYTTNVCLSCQYHSYIGRVYHVKDSLFERRNSQMGELGMSFIDDSCCYNKNKFQLFGKLSIRFTPSLQESNELCYVFLAKSKDGERFTVVDTLVVTKLEEQFSIEFKPNKKDYIIFHNKYLNSNVYKTNGFIIEK